MLRFFRVRRRSVVTASLLFLSMAMTTVGALEHEVTGHDLPASVAHDASAHRIHDGATPAASHSLHCLACQWVRSLRSRPTVTYQPAPAVESRLRPQPTFFPVAAAALAAQPPLRSPPTA